MKNKFSKGQLILFFGLPLIVTAIFSTDLGYVYQLDHMGVMVPEFEIRRL
jgi:hypothetical protein